MDILIYTLLVSTTILRETCIVQLLYYNVINWVVFVNNKRIIWRSILKLTK
jgi:hypothetical protein